MASETRIGVGEDLLKQPANPQASVPEADALVKTLTSLIRRIPGAGAAGSSGKGALRRGGRPDPAFKLALITVATQALSALRSGNLTTAAAAAERLQQGLDGAWGETASAAVVDKIRRALGRFAAAERTVDGQIGQLRAVLRRSDDPELRDIGEFGMNGLTGDARVKLQAAILQLRASLPVADPRLAAAVSGLAEQLASYLSESEKVKACDNNPFGVPVSIAATLGGAARRLHEVLRHVS